MACKIYVALVAEGIACWRPVKAHHLRADLYRIDEQPPEGERWKFLSGELVRCKQHTFSDGRGGWLAIEKVAP